MRKNYYKFFFKVKLVSIMHGFSCVLYSSNTSSGLFMRYYIDIHIFVHIWFSLQKTWHFVGNFANYERTTTKQFNDDSYVVSKKMLFK